MGLRGVWRGRQRWLGDVTQQRHANTSGAALRPLFHNLYSHFIMAPSTQPRILCQAGSSLSSLQPVAVNSGEGIKIDSSEFEGSIAVRIRDYLGPKSKEGPRNPEHGFSEAADTWSVQIQGRFKVDGLTADEVLWGNSWEKPIRDYLREHSTLRDCILPTSKPTCSANPHSVRHRRRAKIRQLYGPRTRARQ